MARQIKILNARRVESELRPGRHADGGGLYLDVSPAGSRKWVFLYRSPSHRITANGHSVGKLREMGFGRLDSVPLAAARVKASDARRLLDDRIDPLDNKAAQVQLLRTPTFAEMAEEVVSALEAGWRNSKHRAQWRSTLSQYCTTIRAKPVNEIDTGDIYGVLSQIWTTKAETASRLRGRIEKVLDAAKARGFRTGENPARWRGHLDHLLPPRQKLQRGHHPAMPWRDVPEFLARLRQMNCVSARCLEFVILLAPRSGEVLRSVRSGIIMGARWDEIDRDTNVWCVPAVRMKMSEVHRKPLTPRALEILDEMESMNRCVFIFPNETLDGPLGEMALEMLLRRMGAKPNTVHGFRTSFRTWVEECTNFSDRLAEMQLAHRVGSAVERAYQRGDALERRREMMEAWELYIGSNQSDNVVAISFKEVG